MATAWLDGVVILVGDTHLILRDVDVVGEFLRNLATIEELEGHGMGLTVVDDGADCGIVRGTHVEVLGLEIYLVAYLASTSCQRLEDSMTKG